MTMSNHRNPFGLKLKFKETEMLSENFDFFLQGCSEEVEAPERGLWPGLIFNKIRMEAITRLMLLFPGIL